jgi:hypothetical protein
MVAMSCSYGIISCSADVEQHNDPEIRLDKVLDVRQKLISGKYNVAEHLDVVVDRLLEDILVQQPPK